MPCEKDEDLRTAANDLRLEPGNERRFHVDLCRFPISQQLYPAFWYAQRIDRIVVEATSIVVGKLGNGGVLVPLNADDQCDCCRTRQAVCSGRIEWGIYIGFDAAVGHTIDTYLSRCLFAPFIRRHQMYGALTDGNCALECKRTVGIKWGCCSIDSKLR